MNYNNSMNFYIPLSHFCEYPSVVMRVSSKPAAILSRQKRGKGAHASILIDSRQFSPKAVVHKGKVDWTAIAKGRNS